MFTRSSYDGRSRLDTRSQAATVAAGLTCDTGTVAQAASAYSTGIMVMIVSYYAAERLGAPSCIDTKE